MKKILKKIAVLFAMFILTAEVASVMQQVDVSAASVRTVQNNAKKAYKSYVRKYLKPSAGYPYGKYKLYDINRDGIPEMFFTYATGVRCGYKIYTYKKGKIIKMLDVTGASGIYRNAKKKQICICFSGGAADNWFIYYKMKNKKLVHARKYHNISKLGGSPLRFY